MTSPAISVLMPVYNGEKHLAEAVDSILAQTFTDFEFIIVDDASTDATASLLADCARRDLRIRILTNESNSKIAFSLNRGLAAACAPLIARMDADDWSHPERLAKQYAFMQAHPEVTVCGARFAFYEAGEALEWPCGDAEIRAHMLFNSPIAHPTAVFRKEAVLRLAGGYDAAKPPTEDYDLWARLAAHVEVRFANLPDVLLRYRVYPGKQRAEYQKKQFHGANAVRCMLLERWGLTPTEREMASHLSLCGTGIPPTLSEFYGCWRWKKKLLAQNRRLGLVAADTFAHVLGLQWHGLVRRFSLYSFLRTLYANHAPEVIQRGYRLVRDALRR